MPPTMMNREETDTLLSGELPAKADNGRHVRSQLLLHDDAGIISAMLGAFRSDKATRAEFPSLVGRGGG